MKTDNILRILRKSSVTIPGILLKYSKMLNINSDEIIFLAYIMKSEEKYTFDIEELNRELGFDIPNIMTIVDSLTNKKLLVMNIEKNKNGMMMEYLDVSFLFTKVLDFILEESNDIKNNSSNDSNIYEIIEKEFGRTISPIEYETIKGWLDSAISEELIKEALKEAVLNGVNNLKYIDKILYEWNKKGYKKVIDIKKKKDKTDDVVNLFDYDWLEDNE